MKAICTSIRTNMRPRIADTDESDVIPPFTGCFDRCWHEERRKAVEKFFAKIQHPRYFLLFNALCIVQTIPALYYYISFFQEGFYLINSSGMPPIWGCTIGAIATAIATSAFLPIPSAISTAFCVAVVLWEFFVSVSLFIAAVCLALRTDFYGFAWSLLGSMITCFATCFLIGLGLHARKENLLNPISESSFEDVMGPSSRSGNVNCDGRTVKSDAKFQIPNDRQILSRKYSPAEGDEATESKSTVESGTLLSPRIEISQAIRTRPKDPPKLLRLKIDLPLLFKNESASVEFQEELSYAELCAKISSQVILWIILLALAIIPATFGVEQVVQLRESQSFGPPGTLYLIPIAENSTVSFKMHMHCRGVKGNKPLILLEADAGTSGFSLFNIQKALSGKWRVCLYDRGGYGWSSLPPLGSSTPASTLFRLNKLIQAAEEGHTEQGLILVGHGVGGEIMQAYANRYPSQVSGLALLDVYPSIERLRGYPTDRIHASTLKSCGALQISRTIESLAILRTLSDAFYYSKTAIVDGAFYPEWAQTRYISTQTNGRYWAARYNDFCVNAGAASAWTDYLERASGSSPRAAVFSGNAVSWPSIPKGKPVLIVSAGSTVNGASSDSALCYHQAMLYNQTLSPSTRSQSTSKWIIRDSCHHSLAIDADSTGVAADIDRYFRSYYN